MDEEEGGIKWIFWDARSKKDLGNNDLYPALPSYLEQSPITG